MRRAVHRGVSLGVVLGLPGLSGPQVRHSHARPSASDITQALRVLGVDVSCKGKELKKKYLELVRQHHPDKGGSEEAMKNVTSAYKLLDELTETERKTFNSAGRSYSATRKGPSGGTQHHRNAYDFQNAYRKRYEQEKQEHYYRYDPSGQKFHNEHATYGHYTNDNPFQASGFRTAAMRMSRMPTSMLLFRGFVIYTIIASLVVMMFRTYRDYVHDDGWNSSSVLSRHERLEDLQRMRQEVRDRLKDKERQFYDQRRGELDGFKERRALDYAERRSQEVKSFERGCWPRLSHDGSQGQIIKYPHDPVGITYFDPTPTDAKRPMDPRLQSGPRPEISYGSLPPPVEDRAAVEPQRALPYPPMSGLGGAATPQPAPYGGGVAPPPDQRAPARSLPAPVPIA